MASSNNSDETEKLREEVGSLHPSVNELALSCQRTNEFLQQLLLIYYKEDLYKLGIFIITIIQFRYPILYLSLLEYACVKHF